MKLVDLLYITEYMLRVSGGREKLDLGRLKGVSVFLDRSIIVGDEIVGSVSSDVSF